MLPLRALTFLVAPPDTETVIWAVTHVVVFLPFTVFVVHVFARDAGTDTETFAVVPDSTALADGADITPVPAAGAGVGTDGACVTGSGAGTTGVGAGDCGAGVTGVGFCGAGAGAGAT